MSKIMFLLGGAALGAVSTYLITKVSDNQILAERDENIKTLEAKIRALATEVSEAKKNQNTGVSDPLAEQKTDEIMGIFNEDFMKAYSLFSIDPKGADALEFLTDLCMECTFDILNATSVEEIQASNDKLEEGFQTLKDKYTIVVSDEEKGQIITNLDDIDVDLTDLYSGDDEDVESKLDDPDSNPWAEGTVEVPEEKPVAKPMPPARKPNRGKQKQRPQQQKRKNAAPTVKNNTTTVVNHGKNPN